MAKTRYAVQFEFAVKDGDQCGLLIEQLRYAHLLTVVSTRDLVDGEVYTLRMACPVRGLDEQTWANQTAERMRSFGLRAEAFPVRVS